MKKENKRTRLERIMNQMCKDFGEFGVQEGTSLWLSIRPPRIYFNFVEGVEDGMGTNKLKGTDFSMADIFSIAEGYKLVMDEEIGPEYKDKGLGLAFDLRKLENGELYI